MRVTNHADLEIDPIRQAAVLGQSLVVVTDGSLFPRVREALAVAGRTHDLRTVRIDGYDRSLVVDQSSRRLAAGAALPDEAWSRSGGHLGPSQLKQARGSLLTGDPDLSFLPELDFEDVLGGGCVLAILGGGMSTANVYGVWALHQAALRARAEGRAEPALVVDKPEARRREGLVELAQAYGFEPMNAPGCDAALGLVASVRWGCLGPRRDGRDPWAAALEAFDARDEVVRGAGWTCIAGGGKAVVATLRNVDPAITQDLVWEILPDGRCSAALASLDGKGGLDGQVRRVWRGGIPPTNAARGTLAGIGPVLRRLERKAHLPAGTFSASIDDAFQAAIGDRPGYQLIAGAVHADPDRAPRRRDFAVTWPAFADLLLRDGIRAGVDAGTETVALVSAAYGISPAVARRMVGLRLVPRIRPVADAVNGAALGYLAAFGHDRLPTAGDRQGWAALAALSGWLSGFAHPTVVEDGIAVRLLTAVPGRTWAERGVRLGDRSARNDADVLRALSAWLRAISGRNVTREMALGIMLEHGSLSKVAAATDRWHADGLLGADTQGLPLDLTWPVPFEAHPLGEGLEARVLGGVQALVDEGAKGPDSCGLPGLHHCVGGYGRQCQTAESLIVSIRRVDGGVSDRLSTAELVPGPHGEWSLDGRPYRLRQHRGMRNAEPPPEAAAGLLRLREALAAGEIPLDGSALDRRLAAAAKGDARHAACFHAAWRRILPKRYADAPLADLARMMEEVAPTLPAPVLWPRH